MCSRIKDETDLTLTEWVTENLRHGHLAEDTRWCNMSDFPRRTPDRSIKARPMDTFSPELLARVISGLCGPMNSPESPTPARIEVPRTADELPRVPGYPKPNALDPHASRYAATMRQ